MLFTAVSSFCKNIPAWGWVDILFTAVVLFGVWLEASKSARFFAQLKFPKNLLGREMLTHARHESLKHFGWKLVVLGIAGEVVCLAFSLDETAKLNDKAQRASERTAIVESNNLVLRSNVDALHLQLIETSNKVAVVNEKVADLSNLITSTNIAEFRDAFTSKTLSEAELKKYLRVFLESVNSEILYRVDAGNKQIGIFLGDVSESKLTMLSKQPNFSKFLTFERGSNVIIGNGSIGDFLKEKNVDGTMTDFVFSPKYSLRMLIPQKQP
jgi:hypothetical protein